MSTINYEGLIEKIGQCCLTENSCGVCQKSSCLIGYCKQTLLGCLKQNSDFVDDGMVNIPYDDVRIYDTETIINALAHLLHECRNCNVYHDEECIINVVRSTFEIILLGEANDYNGSTLLYLNDIKGKNPVIAGRIFNAFQAIKK